MSYILAINLLYLNIDLSGCTSVTVGLGLYVNTSEDSLMAPSKYTTNGSDVPTGASVVRHVAKVSLTTFPVL